MRRETLPRAIYDYFIKHWFAAALLLTLSSYWFVILRIVGKDWDLINTDGSLTLFANIITWPLFGLSVIFAILKTKADQYNEQAKNNGQYVLEHIMQGVNAAKSAKLRRFCQYIEANHTSGDLYAFRDITQPRVQIEKLLENLQITLSEIFGISRDDIGLSIIYRFDKSVEWRWLYAMNTTDDLDLGTLVNNNETSVRQVIDDKLHSVFYPDKRIGIVEHKYLPGAKDRHFNNVGSVLCRDLSIWQEKRNIRAILSITTYGKQLCEDGDRDSLNKIENLIVSAFTTRLQLELSLLYIKEVLSPKCLDCPS